MGLHFADYEQLTADAVAHFWNMRALPRADRLSRAQQPKAGFAALVKAIVVANNLPGRSVYSRSEPRRKNRHVALPGYYRPARSWDLLVVHKGQLVAALAVRALAVRSLLVPEAAPSGTVAPDSAADPRGLRPITTRFHRRFRARCEEAIAMGQDLRLTFAQGLVGPPPRPFKGYLLLVEDAPVTRAPIRIQPGHFSVDPAFERLSYADYCNMLCRRMVAEGLYDAAALLLSPAPQGEAGLYREVSPETGLRRFVTTLAGRVAAAATMT